MTRSCKKRTRSARHFVRTLVLFTTLLLLAFSAAAESGGQLVENVVAQNDPTQSYTLFLPSSYDPAKRHPLLLIFDPRGRGTVAAGIFRDAAEEYGWVLISLNGTQSDVVDRDPNQAALSAVLPDIARYAVDPRRIYVAGFSGTVVIAWALGVKTKGLAGVIGVGARVASVVPPETFSFPHYGFAGEGDFNNREMRAIHAVLEREGKVHRFEEFPGPHRWIPSELARDAVAWFEMLAMKNETRTRDDSLILRTFERDTGLASLAESEGRKLDALRRFRAIAVTFDGLRDIDDIRGSIAQLERDPAVKHAQKEEARWDRFEENFKLSIFAKLEPMLTEFRNGEKVPTASRFVHELRIVDLMRRAQRSGPEGSAARRLLESIHVQLSFYLIRQFFERQEHAIAAAALAASLEIHSDRPIVWYNLGAAQARLGDRRRAVQSLHRAIELGYSDGAHVANDEDYAALREDDRFKALVESIANDR